MIAGLAIATWVVGALTLFNSRTVKEQMLSALVFVAALAFYILGSVLL